jgi:hypothetical protein
MNPAILRRKFIEQIQRLPDEKLNELYEIIHFFSTDTKHAEPCSKDNVMRFAGCWDFVLIDGFVRITYILREISTIRLKAIRNKDFLKR